MINKIESNEYLNKANLIKYLTQLQSKMSANMIPEKPKCVKSESYAKGVLDGMSNLIKYITYITPDLKIDVNKI